MTITNNIYQNGGEVIASGGFGCIFKPALKCENDDSEYRDTNKITKLMTTNYATEEYKRIQTFKNVLQTIPNFNNYFLFQDITLCKPNKLTNNDMKHLKKCKNLKKKGIKIDNINQSLDKLLALNMPDGGIDIEKFTSTYFIPQNIIRLNNSLIQLLVHGILPMNKLNVYHCDIKDGNILVKVTEMGFETRLIDWGLSFIQTSTEGIHKNLYRRPFQYNVPFSSILFNKDFSTKYTAFLEKVPNPDYFQIREFIINYIFFWNKIRGSGHLSAINEIIRKLTIKDLTSIKKTKVKEHFVEYDFTYYYIIEYLSKILQGYTKDGHFDIMTYFNKVFLRNIDIWGFVMTYIVFYEYLYDSYDTVNYYQKLFMSKIKYIIIRFLYETPLEPINVSSLTSELTKLNSILEKMEMNPIVKNGGKNKQTTKRGKTEKTGKTGKIRKTRKTRKNKNKNKT